MEQPKFYIAIKDGKVIANWGGFEELTADEIKGICNNETPDEVREIDRDQGVTDGFPLSCYNDDWSLKTPEEIEKLGFDGKGNKLPTEQEKAEQKAKEQRKEKLQESQRQLNRKIIRNQNYIRVNFAPIAQALARNSYDKTKTFAQQRLDIARIEKRELENLKSQNKEFLDNLEQQTPKYQAELAKVSKELETLETELQALAGGKQ